MCRLLLAQFKRPTQPRELLARFAEMSKYSKALDGDWQGDGWGLAWLTDTKEWHTRKSLSPIWDDTESFSHIPNTSICIAHARSASFPQHKGIIEFNQPYLSGKYAYVFNGLLRGVTLSSLPGKIGAEKIWYLLQQELKNNNPQEALAKLKQLLIDSSKEIIALNIGLATNEKIYSLNYFTRNSEYYSLHHWVENDVTIICSELL